MITIYYSTHHPLTEFCKKYDIDYSIESKKFIIKKE